MSAHGHSRADARNLYLHRAALANLLGDPALRERCLSLVTRWLAQPEQRPAWPYLERWREMLAHWPPERIAPVVLDEEGGQALRQCSPLGPALTPRERWQLLREINQQLDSGLSDLR
jgi:hypothetical protein